MMKKIVIIIILLFALSFIFGGCAESTVNSGERIGELPENAEAVYSYIYSGDYSEKTGIYGEGITLESWSVSGSGYFILEIDYHSGIAENLEIRMNDPENKTFCSFTKPYENGLYATGSAIFTEKSNFVLGFGKAEDLKASFTVYFVREGADE